MTWKTGVVRNAPPPAIADLSTRKEHQPKAVPCNLVSGTYICTLTDTLKSMICTEPNVVNAAKATPKGNYSAIAG